ncbi:MAG: ATP-binding protein, partial [Verrucomicrobiota bacterium]
AGFQGEWVEIIESMNGTLERLGEAHERLSKAQRKEVFSKLTGNIAHDFNNLLSVIMGNADLLQADSKNPSPHIEAIIDAGERAKEHVSHLLAITRQEEAQLQPLPLTDLLTDFREQFEDSLPPGVHFEMNLPEDPAQALRSDRKMLNHIFQQLATNATHSMEDGGTLRVEVDDITVEPGQAPEEWVKPGAYRSISFIDTGSGIDHTVLPNIFEPFFTTKKQSDGAGLGLSMVAGLTRQCGGWVTVDSIKSKGTTVSVHFPATQVVEPAISRLAEPTEPKDARTILVVDDNALVCKMATSMIQKMGHVVLTSSDGEEGLEKLVERGDDIDLVVSDVLMPRLSGPQMIQKFRERGPLPFGVLFITGFSDGELPDDLKELGPDFARLNKPFTFESLKEKVNAALLEDTGLPS